MEIEHLYRQALENDSDAEDKFFAVLRDRFIRFAKLRVNSKEDAEDITQKSLEVVFRKYKQVAISSSITAWVHKVLHYEIQRHYRDQGRTSKLFDYGPDTYELPDQTSIDPLLRRRIFRCLRELVKRNRRYARILLLKREGLSTDEICKGLNVKRSNLYVIVARARQTLRECVEKDTDK